MAPKKTAGITWKALQAAVISMDEEACLAALKKEKAGPCRPQFLLRIHGRYNMLRVVRERSELLRAPAKKLPATK